MKIMLFSNAEGLQNNNYNMVLLCKLGNISDYIYIYVFIYENKDWGNLPGLADKFLCMPIHSLHHIAYICTLFIISMN